MGFPDDCARKELEEIAAYFKAVGSDAAGTYPLQPGVPLLDTSRGLGEHMHRGMVKNVHLIHKPGQIKDRITSYLYFEFVGPLPHYNYLGWVLTFRSSKGPPFPGKAERQVRRLLPVRRRMNDRRKDEFDDNMEIGIGVIMENASMRARFPVQPPVQFGSMIGAICAQGSNMIAAENLLALMLTPVRGSYIDAM